MCHTFDDHGRPIQRVGSQSDADGIRTQSEGIGWFRRAGVRGWAECGSVHQTQKAHGTHISKRRPPGYQMGLGSSRLKIPSIRIFMTNARACSEFVAWAISRLSTGWESLSGSAVDHATAWPAKRRQTSSDTARLALSRLAFARNQIAVRAARMPAISRSKPTLHLGENLKEFQSQIHPKTQKNNT